MRITFHLRETKSGGEPRIQVITPNKSVTTLYTWSRDLWHRGHPKGVNAQGMKASEMRRILDDLRIAVGELPDDCDPTNTILRYAPTPKRPIQATMPMVVIDYCKHHTLSDSTYSQLYRLGQDLKNTNLNANAICDWLNRRKAELAPSSYNVMLSHLKTLLKHGYSSGMIPQSITIDDTKPKVIKSDVLFLTMQELKVLQSVVLPPHLENERKRFLFQCLTGLRHSDLEMFSEDMLNADRDQIRLTLKKTKAPVTIPLNKFAQDLLPFMLNDQTPSASMRDKHIKRICELAGINEPCQRTISRGGRTVTEVQPKWKLMATHTARRSFICNLIAGGVNLPVIMMMTGHASLQSIQPYIAAATTTKADAVKVLEL